MGIRVRARGQFPKPDPATVSCDAIVITTETSSLGTTAGNEYYTMITVKTRRSNGVCDNSTIFQMHCAKQRKQSKAMV